MIKWLILICGSAFLWYEGYRYGFDQGYSAGVQAERDDWQLRNVRAALRMMGGKHGKDESVDQ